MSNEGQLVRKTSLPRAAWDWTLPRLPAVGEAVQDSLLMRGARILVHLFTRACMHWYHELRVIHPERFLDKRPAVIAPNHSSHLDTLAVLSSLPVSQMNATCAVAARDYFFANPALALVARLMANGIPISRQDNSGNGLELCAERLRGGTSLIMFPEGRRTRTGELGVFKPGAVVLSRHGRVPVVPTYIRGTRESMGWSKWFPRRERITVVFGEPLRFWEGPLADLDAKDAAKRLEDEVRRLRQQLEAEGGNG
ncbi:MAG: 1-acyl-sn-glycerol-3-phosphate acyltransferase [Planctomycetes bacterium]|nr:1-acyl-sn-glycerol-3-phosphate acyltransferase [Planctomycetota bacterium]